MDLPTFTTPNHERPRSRDGVLPSECLTRPLSGPGTSRQTRRLQLRNAGFRAAALPTRKVTPKSLSSSTNWSAASGKWSGGGSDAENLSPTSGLKVGGNSELSVEKRRSSGILAEIGNTNLAGSTTVTRPRSARKRISSGRDWVMEEEALVLPFTDGLTSPPPTKTNAIRMKSAKMRAKIAGKRRSVSGEARMYIEHLEAELASAQAQLQAINSPSVTREQSSRLRSLHLETQQLQNEVAAWEERYEERVKEELDRQHRVEVGLRSQVRRLEQDAEEARYQLVELEAQLDTANQTVEAVERANVNLEKRLEIMSELLAASPTKIDLHAVTPGMMRKHARPKSMAPRFPTASSLVTSPVREHHPNMQPTSPAFTFTEASIGAPLSTLGPHRLTLDTILTLSSDAVSCSDAESVFSPTAAPGDGDSTTTVSEHPPLPPPNFNLWNMQAVHQSAKCKPVGRRMRRFGAGSMGPKPLILPSTSGCDLIPGSAPPLFERSGTMPAYTFQDEENRRKDLGDQESPSSQLLRRRASTTADESTLANLEASSFLQPPPPRVDVVSEENMMSWVCPPSSASSQATTSRNFSSLGSVAGRNLMDELTAVQTNGMYSEGAEDAAMMGFETKSCGKKGRVDEAISARAMENSGTDDTGLCYGNEVEEGIDVHSILSADGSSSALKLSISDDPRPIVSRIRRHVCSPSTTTTTAGPNSAHSLFYRLRHFFADLWQSPVLLARHLVQTAQDRMLRMATPLRNVQWWLVGVLLGPMARHRMMSSRSSSSRGREIDQQGLLASDMNQSENMAYGTVCYSTPPSTPACHNNVGSTTAFNDPSANGGSRPGTISGKGKKRVQHKRQSSLHHQRRRASQLRDDERKKGMGLFRRHSPWLWLKFSLTLAFAVGVAFADGPGSLLRKCECVGDGEDQEEDGQVA
ncbi:hypothetical protein M433DRAFT_173406 [Acidomyces richmondensis BFW]|nr:MAG: hypothetical protein FE78DRAFT_86277 [Acidomyces sp. 'richmondensis']KYG46722.1 hypothetical protein M433DRAFT_173406 [Acidomyces richmondensis BFW]